MAIWGSFTTSTMAMMAHSRHMGQIGTNIANMNTTSYKEVETTYQTLKSNRSQGWDFFSADTVDTRRVDVQGVVTATDRTYDLAINGHGFFVTNSEPDGSGQTLYTRDGGFTGAQTTMGEDSDGDGQVDQGTLLVTQQGQYVMGWAATEDGTGFTQTLGPVTINHNAIIPGRVTSAISMSGNVANVNGQATSPTYQTSLPVVSSHAGTDGDTTTRLNNMVMTWSKVPDVQNTWTVDFPVAGNPGMTGVSFPNDQVVFRGDGRLDTTATTVPLQATITWDDGSTQTVDIDISTMTQYASPTGGLVVDGVNHDGYTEGRLDRTDFNAQGVLSGYFSNGVQRPLYKLPIATFAVPNKLEALNGNVYRESADSGTATLNSLSLGDYTSLQPGALETSNVVLEDQFTRMITTQKAYSSSATVFKTSDEMIQEVRNLKR